MKLIPLTQGKLAKVSDRDYAYLRQWKWCLLQGTYAVRHRRKDDPPKPNIIRMHRVVARRKGLRNPDEVDHHDRDGLNNTRRNLRPASKVTNGRNRGPNRNNTSGFKGVSRYGNRWAAEIKVDSGNATTRLARTHARPRRVVSSMGWPR